MATRHLTTEEFDELVEGTKGIILVDFWAGWCAPCRVYSPTFEKVSEQHPDIIFAKVDTEAEPELSIRYRIMGIPMTFFIKDGVLVHQQPGAMAERDLEHLIQAVRDVELPADEAEQKAA